MAEVEGYEIVVRVVSQKGTCAAGHNVGDTFIIGDTKPAAELCAWAVYVIFPFSSVLKWGGSFPWEDNPDKSLVACPDPGNPVVFELTRRKK